MEIVQVTAKIINIKPWKDNNVLARFDSVEPFLNAGLNHGQLANKTHRTYPDYTLFVNKEANAVVGCGWALFEVSIQTYPKITFIENTPPADKTTLEYRVAKLEKQVARLTVTMEKMGRVIVDDDSSSSSDSSNESNESDS